jgi:hypothetical protein
MNLKKNFKDKIVKDIQSCFQKINLEILEVKESKGNYVIKSEVDFKSFKMPIIMTYLIKKEIVAVIIEFTSLIPEYRFNDIYDIINRINTMLMDIGHFKLSPKNRKILLCTGFNVATGILDICQFEESIKRIIGQWEICYEIIAKVAFDNISPDEVWRDCMCQLRYSPDNGNPTFH